MVKPDMSALKTKLGEKPMAVDPLPAALGRPLKLGRVKPMGKK